MSTTQEIIATLTAAIDAYQGDTGPVTWSAQDHCDKALLIGAYSANAVNDRDCPLTDEPWKLYGGDAIIAAAGLEWGDSGMDADQDKWGDDMVSQWVSFPADPPEDESDGPAILYLRHDRGRPARRATTTTRTQIMITYQISTQPQYYGSDATDADGDRCARIIAERLRALYPSVRIEIVAGEPRSDFDDPADRGLLDEIVQQINDNWVDWVD